MTDDFIRPTGRIVFNDPMPSQEDFAKDILQRMAELFGLTFEQMSAPYRGRFPSGGYAKLPYERGMFRVEIPEPPSITAFRWRLRTIALVGYDPQLLLEDRRGRV